LDGDHSRLVESGQVLPLLLARLARLLRPLLITPPLGYGPLTRRAYRFAVKLPQTIQWIPRLLPLSPVCPNRTQPLNPKCSRCLVQARSEPNLENISIIQVPLLPERAKFEAGQLETWEISRVGRDRAPDQGTSSRTSTPTRSTCSVPHYR